MAQSVAGLIAANDVTATTCVCVESVRGARLRRRGEDESVQVDVCRHVFRRDEVQTAATGRPG